MAKPEGKKLTKAQAVKDAFQTLGNDAMPKPVQDLVKEKTGLDVSTT